MNLGSVFFSGSIFWEKEEDAAPDMPWFCSSVSEHFDAIAIAGLDDEINYLTPSPVVSMTKINSVASLHQAVDYYIPVDANTITQHQSS